MTSGPGAKEKIEQTHLASCTKKSAQHLKHILNASFSEPSNFRDNGKPLFLHTRDDEPTCYVEAMLERSWHNFVERQRKKKACIVCVTCALS
ncbi:predicted protein [Plenodomus lingam JN3]|uniref:Predicted protein n=1 Tax=Leptosphaeria maculans (strain JN3 / isolate v23.1.3 / race Av1-4-5-6-7-8) TaxID=985895 RepID=E4ZNE7_LEPMJ|nr:predicted protein [Plenodomus lingam JN3]CBX93006.1 predicted protein [Plenodomus lingam JN3]